MNTIHRMDVVQSLARDGGKEKSKKNNTNLEHLSGAEANGILGHAIGGIQLARQIATVHVLENDPNFLLGGHKIGVDKGHNVGVHAGLVHEELL